MKPGRPKLLDNAKIVGVYLGDESIESLARICAKLETKNKSAVIRMAIAEFERIVGD